MTSILKLIQVNFTYICHGLIFSWSWSNGSFTTTYAIGAFHH
jgi:hypothetical protein